jgi:hypothetical protein
MDKMDMRFLIGEDTFTEHLDLTFIYSNTKLMQVVVLDFTNTIHMVGLIGVRGGISIILALGLTQRVQLQVWAQLKVLDGRTH